MVRHRPGEVDTIPNPKRRCDRLQALLLTLVTVPTVFTQDHESQVWMGAVAEESQSADRDLDSLQPFEPADEQEHRSVQPDLPARLGAIKRPEGGEVDARGHDENAIGARAVSVDELLALVRRRGNEQVGVLRNLGLDLDPDRRLGPRAAGEMLVLDQAQRVGDVRPAGRHVRPEQAGDLARKPVVREEEVVLDSLRGRERCDLVREPGHLVEEGVLVEPHSGRQVNHPREGRQGLDCGIVRRLKTREDVGGDAAVAEGATHLAHIDVEAAVGVLAQRCGGRGVHGNDRDPPLRTAVQG